MKSDSVPISDVTRKRMEQLAQQLRLYAVTDRRWLNGRTLAQDVEEAILGGVSMVQLREKHANNAEFEELARSVQPVCGKYNVPFIVNDNVDVALAVDADGVHVGQQDMQAGKVRERIGVERILGVSAQTVEQALAAEAAGADYIGVGAVFTTASKDDAQSVSFDELRRICSAVRIPVVAIGGIEESNVTQLAGTGIVGISVISAIFAQTDSREAAWNLRRSIDQITEKE